MSKIFISDEPCGDFGTLQRSIDDSSLYKAPPVSKSKMKRAVTQGSLFDSKSRPSTSSAQKEDTREENGVWFWVNKNGFPVDDQTWERMWDHVSKIHPEGYKMVSTVRGNTSLPPVTHKFVTLYLLSESTMSYNCREKYWISCWFPLFAKSVT